MGNSATIVELDLVRISILTGSRGRFLEDQRRFGRSIESQIGAHRATTEMHKLTNSIFRNPYPRKAGYCQSVSARFLTNCDLYAVASSERGVQEIERRFEFSFVMANKSTTRSQILRLCWSVVGLGDCKLSR